LFEIPATIVIYTAMLPFRTNKDREHIIQQIPTESLQMLKLFNLHFNLVVD
jgi:hypothetical protein